MHPPFCCCSLGCSCFVPQATRFRCPHPAPCSAKAYYRRGDASYALGHFKDAMRDFRAAIRLAPSDPDLRRKVAGGLRTGLQLLAGPAPARTRGVRPAGCLAQRPAVEAHCSAASAPAPVRSWRRRRRR